VAAIGPGTTIGLKIEIDLSATAHGMINRRKLFLTGMLLALNATVATGGEALQITANVWPPYVDDKMSGNGVAIALVTEALERAGYASQLVLQPWPGALEATQQGVYDIVCSLWFTEDRAATLSFSEPYIENHIKFVKRSDSDILYNDRDDLDGLRIGVVNDYAYSAQPYDTTGIEVTKSGSVKENIQRLLNKEIDLVLADSRIAFFEVDQLSAAKRITVLPKPLITRGLRIGVSKQRPDHAEIVAAFNRAIKQMKEDGSYNSLLANYRISDW
jgi:polar amino acid transport system substrate-binding protein